VYLLPTPEEALLQRAETSLQRADKLAKKRRSLGINPEEI
jgi:hypothetical protein